jgi:hypothetical protein
LAIALCFCDLVGSTGIAARLDAEEWRDLSRRLWTRYGGLAPKSAKIKRVHTHFQGFA